MGDYFHNRLFCVHEKLLYSTCPSVLADRISLPCVRHDPGGLLPAQDGF